MLKQHLPLYEVIRVQVTNYYTRLLIKCNLYFGLYQSLYESFSYKLGLTVKNEK